MIEVNERWTKSGSVGDVDLDLKTLYEQVDSILDNFAVNLEHQLKLNDKSMVGCVLIKKGLQRALEYLSESNDPELFKFLRSTNLDLQYHRWPYDKSGQDEQSAANDD